MKRQSPHRSTDEWTALKKTRRIEAELELIEDRLANAEAYLAKSVNVEGTGFLHFTDWEGKSGHPLWMKNFMIPATKKARAKREKALDTIGGKDKARRLKQRRQTGSRRRREDV